MILTISHKHLSDLIAGACIDFNWAARQDLVISLPQYSNYDLIKARSSQSTYIKIEIR